MDRQPVALAISARGGCRARRHRRGPPIGAFEPVDHLEQRRLAGAVRADDADDRGLLDGEIGLEREGRAADERARACRPCGRARARAAARPSVQLPAGAARSAPSARKRPRRRRSRRSGRGRARRHGRRPTARSRRSARRRARRCPRSCSRRMIASTSSTIFGASPWLGSSNRTRPGEPSSARAIATICISPPDRVSHSRAIRYSSGEKISQASLTRPGAEARALLRRCARFLRDRQRRAEPAVVRHPADAGAGDLVRRPAA